MNPWAPVIGGKRDGKDEVLWTIAHRLRSRGVRTSGCIQIPIRRGDDVIGYDIMDVRTKERLELARSGSRNPTICDLEFIDSSFERVREWIRVESDVVILPVGRIELGERGHWPAIRDAFESSARVVLLAVRPHLIAPLALRLSDPAGALELPADNAALDRFVDELQSLTRIDHQPAAE